MKIVYYMIQRKLIIKVQDCCFSPIPVKIQPKVFPMNYKAKKENNKQKKKKKKNFNSKAVACPIKEVIVVIIFNPL